MSLAQQVGNKNWQISASSCAGFATMRVTVQMTICVSFQSFSPQNRQCGMVSSRARRAGRARNDQRAMRASTEWGSIARGGLLGDWEQPLLMSRQHCSKSDAPIGDH
jgi:hypothetical protein